MSSGRQHQLYVPHHIRYRFNYNDAGIAAGVKIGTLPADAIVIATHSVIETAFNAGTTNTVSVGKTALGTEFVNATAAGAATAVVSATPAAANTVFAAEQDLYVSYAQTGTAATAGKGTVIVSYAVNNG